MCRCVKFLLNCPFTRQGCLLVLQNLSLVDAAVLMVVAGVVWHRARHRPCRLPFRIFLKFHFHGASYYPGLEISNLGTNKFSYVLSSTTRNSLKPKTEKIRRYLLVERVSAGRNAPDRWRQRKLCWCCGCGTFFHCVCVGRSDNSS